jgi:hypothetical protein
LPSTDGGVYAQAIGAVALFAIALWFVRRNRDLVWFVAGLATLTAGFMGLRILHRTFRARMDLINRTVSVLHVPGCPNATVAVDRTHEATGSADEVSIHVVLVGTDEEAKQVGMRGPLTIFVDGVDLFTIPPGKPTSIACRVAPGGDPVPSVEALRSAIVNPV